jgi:hypothetical protein
MKKDFSQQELLGLFTYKPDSGELVRMAGRAAGRVAGSKLWCASGKKNKIQVTIDGWVYSVHRIIWTMVNGSIDSRQFIDHINGDPFDNRISNLRLSTNTTNQWNRKAPKNSTSGVKGVTWSRPMEKWKSAIKVNGEFRHLGYFPTKGQAASAHAKASLMMHGAFSPFARKSAQHVNR